MSDHVEIGPVTVTINRLIETVHVAVQSEWVPDGVFSQRHAELLDQAAAVVRSRIGEQSDDVNQRHKLTAVRRMDPTTGKDTGDFALAEGMRCIAIVSNEADADRLAAAWNAMYTE